MADPAFKGVGQEPGLMIWRIEKMQVVPWERKLYGKFYSGDSYIVLNVSFCAIIPISREEDKVWRQAHAF
jgi:hypothetical protein